MDLSDEEKFFVAHFVLDTYWYVKPVCGKYISLFSYLDQTDEPIDIQKKQIEEDDWYFSELLERIYKKSDEKTWNNVFKELNDNGFFENENFYRQFNAIASWVYSKESLRYFFEAKKEAGESYAELSRMRKIKNAEEAIEKQNKIKSKFSNSKSEKQLEEERIKAMKLLNKKVGTSKSTTSRRNLAGFSANTLRPKLDDYGIDWWREQE